MTPSTIELNRLKGELMMHQPIDPYGNNRGVFGHYVLCSGIRIATTEGMMWDRLHRRMYPNAGTHIRQQLQDRMMRTLQADPSGPPMSKTERLTRVKQLQNSIDRIPPDAHNRLMGP
jgi:methyl coenzyme M reductase gamma subunit